MVHSSIMVVFRPANGGAPPFYCSISYPQSELVIIYHNPQTHISFVLQTKSAGHHKIHFTTYRWYMLHLCGDLISQSRRYLHFHLQTFGLHKQKVVHLLRSTKRKPQPQTTTVGCGCGLMQHNTTSEACGVLQQVVHLLHMCHNW